MVRKRARLGEDNDPLTSTDKVLAGFEELSKSTSGQADKLGSQEVEEDAANKTTQETSQQVKKPTSQQASNSKIRQTRRKKHHLAIRLNKIHRKLTSQKVNKLKI
ncbi:MAG: hypothetical protein HC917_03855 [Richelia sp. SM2_1_7]|nr:hypothetical protein [Richelia sp. SM2_1_7]